MCVHIYQIQCISLWRITLKWRKRGKERGDRGHVCSLLGFSLNGDILINERQDT